MARICIITAVLIAMLDSTALAQPGGANMQSAGNRQTGNWSDGKYLGYVPAHVRRQQEAVANSQRAPNQRAASQRRPQLIAQPATSGSEVQTASYQNQQVIEEALPTYSESSYLPADSGNFPIDSSWQGPAYGYPGGCCPPALWVRAELLSWWIDDMGLPPLVTTSPLGTPANTAGALGQAGTRVLFGGDEVSQPAHLGGRFTIGRWLDPCECVGFEASYFFVGASGDDFSANGFDHAILARPFFSTQGNIPAASLVAYPNLLTGSIDVHTSSEMQGFDALARFRGCCNPCGGVTFLAGYRYLNLNESLRIDQASRFVVAQGNIVAGTEQRLFDEFSTQNNFHGAQIGFSYTVQHCCWTIDTQMKFGLGNSHSEVDINGRTRTTVPGGGSATFVGGLLAQETNIGHYTHDELSFVPELTLTARRQLGCNMNFLVGYNLLYWTGAARAGSQIDTSVSQFPPEPATGAGRPRFNFDTSGVLLQGLQLGVEYNF